MKQGLKSSDRRKIDKMASNEGKENKCFLVYYDNEVIVCRLPDEEAGQLFKYLF